MGTDSYRQLQPSWNLIGRKRDVPNFFEHNLPRPYRKDGKLEEIAPNGEIKYSHVGADNFKVRASTKARMFGITRTDIINDSVGWLAELLEDNVLEGYRTLHDDFYDLLKTASFVRL